MCGRLTQYRSWQDMREYYDLVGPAQNLAARYNVAPTETVGVIRKSDGVRQHVAMRWWLIPGWWRKPLNELPAAFNAKAEGIADKPFFRAALRGRRCIVWADGFYEWRRQGKTRTPLYIRRLDGAPLSLAGLWESWTGTDHATPVLSCTIVTCPANAAMRSVHSRMPVVLEKSAIDCWLDGAAGAEILVPCPDDVLVCHEVSSYVNSSRHEGPDCVVPVSERAGQAAASSIEPGPLP